MAEDQLVSVGVHLFTPEALQASLDRTLPQLPPGRSIALGAGLDANGAEVAIMWQSRDGHWTAEAAIEHDWSGDNRIGAKIQGTF